MATLSFGSNSVPINSGTNYSNMFSPQTSPVANQYDPNASYSSNGSGTIFQGSQPLANASPMSSSALGQWNPAPTPAPAPMASAPGGSRTDTSQSAPATTTPPATTANTGLRDMSGQMFAGQLVPQGWSMDSQGNWVNTGAANAAPVNPYNPSPGVYPYGAPKYGANPYSSNPADYGSTVPHDVNTIAGGGIPGLAGNDGISSTPPGQSQVAPSTAPQQLDQNQSAYFTQLLQKLFGSNQPQYNTVKTPLGYTQYQQSVPTGGNAMNQLIAQLLLGMGGSGSGGGGSQNAFWNLLGGQGGSGSSTGNSSSSSNMVYDPWSGQMVFAPNGIDAYHYNQSTGIPGSF